MASSNSTDSAAGIGCSICIAAIAIVAIIYGKVDVAGWFKPAQPVGRYQIVSGRTRTVWYTATEVPTILKVDTATGKTWAFLPIEMPTEDISKSDVLPNRWVEVQDPTPKPSPKNTP